MLPSGHCTQTLLFEAPTAAEAVPIGQLTHAALELAAGVTEYVPGAHGVQTELEEPADEDQVPRGQPEHDEAPAEVANVPAGHWAHDVEPEVGA